VPSPCRLLLPLALVLPGALASGCAALWGGSLQPGEAFAAECDRYHATMELAGLATSGFDEEITVARTDGREIDRYRASGRYQPKGDSHTLYRVGGLARPGSLLDVQYRLRSRAMDRELAVSGGVLEQAAEGERAGGRFDFTVAREGLPVGTIASEHPGGLSFVVTLEGRRYGVVFQQQRRQYVLWACDRPVGFAAISWSYWRLGGRRYDLLLRRDLDPGTLHEAVTVFVMMKLLFERFEG
jgi:hypothetical protein